MPLELFAAALQSLRDEGYKLGEIEYCGQGEAMTHPQFAGFVETARTLFPQTLQRLITNGNFDYARSKLAFAIDEIMVSCDGARQESYEKYRVGGNLSKTFQFMRDIPRLVDGQKQSIIWKYILFEFNDSDDEILEAQNVAESLGIDILQFVFTHSKYKSQRYSLANQHLLPIVWGNARVNATPVQLRQTRSFTPATTGGQWPKLLPDSQTILMLDEVVMDGPGSLRLHGWALSESPLSVVRIRHNGNIVGEAALTDPRPDVKAAYPDHKGRHRNLGFSINWHAEVAQAGTHAFGADLVSIDGATVVSFAREFHAL